VDRGGWTGKVKDFVHFQEKGMDDVMPREFEVRMGREVTDIVFGAREEIIDTDHIRAFFQKRIAEMTPEKPGSSCDQDAVHDFPSFIRMP